MSMPRSGPIKFSEINIANGLTSTTTVNLGGTNTRDLFDVPSGTIKLSDGYGDRFATLASSMPAKKSYTINGVVYTQQRNSGSLTSANHSCAISGSRKVYTWGGNGNGQLGITPYATDRLVPTNISTFGSLSGRIVIAIVGGQAHSMALDSLGNVHTWGFNAYGQLGNNSTNDSMIPINVSTYGSLSGRTVISIACSINHSMALDSLGNVHTWGYSFEGQLGRNSTVQSIIPVNISTFGSLSGRTVVNIGCGNKHSIAIDSLGNVHTWGFNSTGQLGRNNTTNSLIPVNISTFGTLSGKTIIAIAAANAHSMALDSIGNVHTWGFNGNGQLGNNSTVNSLIPINVSTYGSLSGSTIIGIAAGASHSMALDSIGYIHIWGRNVNGQLGINNTINSLTPINISTYGSLSGRTVIMIACGSDHTMALDSSGNIHTWGYNNVGQLGNNSKTGSLVPINIGVLA